MRYQIEGTQHRCEPNRDLRTMHIWIKKCQITFRCCLYTIFCICICFGNNFWIDSSAGHSLPSRTGNEKLKSASSHRHRRVKFFKRKQNFTDLRMTEYFFICRWSARASCQQGTHKHRHYDHPLHSEILVLLRKKSSRTLDDNHTVLPMSQIVS